MPEFPKIHRIEPVYTFAVDQSIGRFGATRDHFVNYWPEDPCVTVQVIQNFGPGCEVELLSNLYRLRLVSQEPAVSALSPEQYLLRALRQRLSA